MSATLRLAAVLLFVAAPGVLGCKRGEVVETVPPVVPLASYRSVTVQTTAAGPVSMHDLTDLYDELTRQLAATKLVGQVVGQGAPAELVLRATIMRRNQQDDLFDNGPVEMTVRVQLLDNVRRMVVGEFDATASSKQRRFVGGGGVSTNLGDDPNERAIGAVVGEIIRYLEERTGRSDEEFFPSPSPFRSPLSSDRAVTSSDVAGQDLVRIDFDLGEDGRIGATDEPIETELPIPYVH